MAVRADVQRKGDLVGHRPGGHEQRRFLAGAFGGELLEPVRGGVVAVPGVTDLGIGHGAAHLGRGLGDRIRSQIHAEVSHRASLKACGPLHRDPPARQPP